MHSNSRRKPLPEVASRARRAVVTLSLLLAIPQLHAVGLGGYEVQSSLGQPLRAVVQVIARADETLDVSCFKIHPYTITSDGLPQLTSSQLTLEKQGDGQRLIIASARPILDPVVRVSIDVGCNIMLRRDLTLLLDPLPAIETQAEVSKPAIAATAATTAFDVSGPGSPAGGAGSSPADLTGALAGTARAEATAAARTARRGRAVLPHKGSAGAAPRRNLKAAGPQTADQPGPTPPNTTRQPQPDRLFVSTAGPPLESYVGAPITPRLTLSKTLTDRSGRPPLPESVLSIVFQKQARLKAAPADEDIPSLEAELVVLQRRAAEMRSQLDTVMALAQSLRESTGEASAPATQPAAIEPAAEATPVSSLPGQAPADPWSWRDPRLLIAVPLGLVIVLLVAGFAIWLRRGQWGSRHGARWNWMPGAPATARPPPHTSFGAGQEMESIERARDETEQPPMRDSYAFSPFSTSHAARELDVSDLAQATEKAGVFVTLGRPEQAIEVLRDHIDHEPKPTPMAWLMLLDLYRQTGRRSEFGEISQQFHVQFNATAPAWDQISPLHDAGLAEFPQLVRKIRDDWPSRKARAYIDELLYDNRGGSRIGFSLPAFRDLLLLHTIIGDHIAALDSPVGADPLSGALIPPPAPPPHLAKVWAAVAGNSPEYPAQPPLQLDAGLLSDSTERSALETDYPIITEAIMQHWGKTGAAEYLAGLIRTTDDNRGPGLSDEGIAELIMLHDVALELGEPQPEYSVE